MAGLSLSGVVGDRRREWPLEGPSISLGRGPENHIQIAEATVSEKHAEIRREGNRWALRDLGSRNGTRLNRRRVDGWSELVSGDLIELGRLTLQVVDDGPGRAAQLSESTNLATTLEIPASAVLGMKPRSWATAAQLVHPLVEAGQLLVGRRPLPKTCDLFLGTVGRVIPASRLVLLLRAGPGPELTQAAARYHGYQTAEPLILSRAIVGSVIDGCKSVITTDAGTDSRFQDRPSVNGLGIHSAMAVPLLDNGQVLGLLYADQGNPAVVYEREQLEILTLFGNMLAVKISNERLAQAEEKNAQLEHELATASRIQRNLLPAECPTLPGYRFHALLEQCEAVGGDLYDFHPMADGTICFVLGDVAGKGISAALLMAGFMASIHALYDSCKDPGELATRLNASIARRGDLGRFVTAFMGRLDTKAGSIQYVNAGHESPLVVEGPSVRELASTGPALGMLPDSVFTTETVQLGSGSLLAAFSDGITQARREEEFFDERRLAQRLRDAAQNPGLEDLGRTIVHDIDEFLAGHPRPDDLTLLLIRRLERGVI